VRSPVEIQGSVSDDQKPQELHMKTRQYSDGTDQFPRGGWITNLLQWLFG
jgi:hypothetical protein